MIHHLLFQPVDFGYIGPTELELLDSLHSECEVLLTLAITMIILILTIIIIIIPLFLIVNTIRWSPSLLALWSASRPSSPPPGNECPCPWWRR